jgi:hypothetical protein
MWGLVLVVLLCAQKDGPPYSATPVPPPRGEPAPNQGHIPPPPPEQLNDSFQQRTPILEGQARKEAARRNAPPPPARVDVVPGKAVRAVDACNAVKTEDKMECPVGGGAVQSVADIPGGVRILFKRGAITPAKLEQVLACQRSLTIVRPQVPPPCPFLGATKLNVTSRHGQAILELTDHDAGLVREQVRTTLSDRR